MNAKELKIHAFRRLLKGVLFGSAFLMKKSEFIHFEFHSKLMLSCNLIQNGL